MQRRYPETLRWRQALPPLFVLSLLTGILIGCFVNFFLILLGLEILVYLAVLFAAGLHTAARRGEGMLVLGIPMAISSMHLAWGSGFLWGIINKLFKSGKAETA